jgi:hypothetical protein
VKIEVPVPAMPRPLSLKDPYWYVVSESNLEEFLTDMRNQSGGNVVFVAMTIADYENMAYNMQEIQRYLTQTKAVIFYYIEATKPDTE